MVAARRRHASAKSTFQQITSHVPGAPKRQEWRRFDLRSALVTTALGTGVLVGASLLSAGQALACVDVTDDPNSVSCDDAQLTTDDTLDVTLAGVDSNDNNERHYLFSDHGAVDVEITTNGDIDDNGLAVTTTQAGSGITVNHQGAISVDDGNNPSEGGDGVFNITTNGGTVTYTGNGSVIDNVGGNSGLVIDTGAGAGDINITAVPDYVGERAALQTISGAGNQNIVLDGGQLVSTAAGFGAGVLATSTTGNIDIELTGNTTITTTVAAPNEMWGVETFASADGGITISSDADMGSAGFEFERGISALSSGGLIDIVQAGGTIMATEAGIFARASGATGEISITTDAGSQLQMTGGTGIVADQSSATGGASVTVHGSITGADTGVNASITDVTNSANVGVTASGIIQALTGSSISATTAGTGNATVNLLTGADLEGGVLAQSTTGSAGIVAGDGVTVDGNSPGMASITAGGSATVAIGNNAMVTGSSGIVVDQTNLADAGVATVVVGNNGVISGDGTDPTDDYDGNGIFAGNQGTGLTSVITGTNTSVTGASNGIVAVQTNPINASDIMISTDGPVSGNGALLLLPPAYAGTFGGLPETGLGIGVSNAGTGDVIVTAGDADASTTGDTVTGANVGVQTLAAGGGDTRITTDAVTGGLHGIRAVATTGGAITVTTHGGVQGTAGDGILTTAVNGDTTITANAAVTGGDDGIDATATGAGNVAIIADGAVTGDDDGIFARTAAGDIAITGSGDITGDNDGDLDGDGINAASSAGGNIDVNVTGAVSGDSGIVLSVVGAGTTDLTTGGPVTGTDGDGIRTSAVDGDTTITANADVTAAGVVSAPPADLEADGIDATATGAGAITVTTAAGTTVTGGDDGIDTSAVAGNTAITANGNVTGGDDGIDATATGAGAITVTTAAGTTVTGGDDGIESSAVAGNTAITANGNVTGGDDGIDATANTGNIAIAANAAVTGDDDGIFARTVAGDIDITGSGDITGDDDADLDGDGINAASTAGGSIDVDVGAVSGASGIALSTNLAGTIDVRTDGAVDGTVGDGIITSAVNGNTAIQTNAAVEGGDDGIDASATGAGNINVAVAAGAEVTGLAGAGVSTDTAAGAATVENAGLIEGAFAAISGATSTVLDVVNQAGGLIRNLSADIGDLAISVTGTGVTDIDNDGTIRGRVSLDAGGDTFNNSGLWATSGTSDFGAGNDSVTNTGHLSVAEQAAVAEITHLSNLEAFTNASTGVIDMVDDSAPNVGDELTIDGLYTGVPGSIIQMDLALVSGDPQAGSDLLVLDAANPATGTSDFLFNIVSAGVTATTEDANRVAFAGGQILAAPVTVVENRGNLITSSGDDEIPLARSGVITYDLVSTANEYQVVSQFDAGLAGGLLLPIPATLATVAFTTQRTPNPITATCIDPDNKANAQGGWARGLAGQFHTESAGEATIGGGTSELESDNHTRFKTLQGGFDHVLCDIDSHGSTLHLGVTVGQTWGESIQQDPEPAAGIFGTDVEFDTFFVGPYAAFTRGNFAAQASLRYDYHSLELSNPTLGVDADGLDVDAEGISGAASMSYDFAMATLTVTPDVGVNVSNTEIDSFDIAGGTVVLDDLWSVMGHAGVTARTEPLGITDNLFVVPFASATLYHEFIEHADGEFDIGGSVIEAESNRVGTFGQVGIGANAVRLGDVVAGRPTLFGGARFDLQVGERIEGATATVFGRVQF